jgi:hypothetical protein
MKPQNMKTFGVGLWIIALALLISWGCVQQPRPAGEGHLIGRLRVEGPNAFVNQRPAHDGMNVYSGDTVSTGPDTQVFVDLADGGFFHIDENTDPEFLKWFDQAKCIIVIFLKLGQGFGETGGRCEVLLKTDHLDAVAKTQFNIKAERQQSILTVIRGDMTLQRPERLHLHSAQQVTVSERRPQAPLVRSLSPRELEEVTQWRQRRPLALGWCCADGEVFQAAPEDCKQRQGFFSYDVNAVRERCRPKPPGGLIERPPGGVLEPTKPPVRIE